MKKVILSLFVVGFAIALNSCGKKEKPVETPAPAAVVETPAPAPAAPAVEKSAEEVAFDAVVAKLDAANQCTVCHKPDVKTIGPAYKEVAKIYKEKNGNIVKFLKGEAKPIVDPANFSQMQPNLEATKKLSGDDLAAIAAYIRTLAE